MGDSAGGSGAAVFGGVFCACVWFRVSRDEWNRRTGVKTGERLQVDA